MKTLKEEIARYIFNDLKVFLTKARKDNSNAQLNVEEIADQILSIFKSRLPRELEYPDENIDRMFIDGYNDALQEIKDLLK